MWLLRERLSYFRVKQCVYLSANRFSMAWENGIHIPFPFFVFRFRMTLKNRYEFRFSFSHHFEKRIWTSFFVFVFASLTLKKGYEFLFSFSHHFEKRIWISFLYGLFFEKKILISFVIWSPRTPPRGWPGSSLFNKGKQLNLAPGPKWVVNSLAPMICPTHTVLLF